MNGKFTVKKYSFGVSKEFEILAIMDIKYHLQLENLNKNDDYSVVDFRIPNTNIYIELKSRKYQPPLKQHFLINLKLKDGAETSYIIMLLYISLFTLLMGVCILLNIMKYYSNHLTHLSKKNGNKSIIIYH